LNHADHKAGREVVPSELPVVVDFPRGINVTLRRVTMKENMNGKRCYFHPVILLALVGIFVCNGTSLGAEKPKITIFTGIGPAFAAVQVAYLKEFFKAEGLDATMQSFATGAEAMEGFRAGKADFLAAGDTPALVLAAGGNTLILCPIGFAYRSNIIISPPEVNRPLDLKGKKVGTKLNSAMHYILVKWLATDGMTEKDIELIDLSPPDGVAALDRGDIYALAMFEPYGIRAKEFFRKEVKTVATPEDMGVLMWASLLTTKTFAEQNPETVGKVIRACRRAVDWLQDTPGPVSENENAIKLLSKYMGITEDLFRIMWSIWGYATITETPGYKLDLKEMAKFMYEKGMIPRKLNIGEILGTKYLKAVDRRLVLE
jgi:NitT/TauT family transport system substrate-binding protein